MDTPIAADEMTTHDKQEEMIVLLNEAGEPIGTAPKLSSHHSNTPLHLAFSVYIFDSNGRVLVTQRAFSKKVWPSVWTNSCCGHPMPSETMTEAIQRRVLYELGMTVTDLRCVIPNYRYKTPPYNGIIENEVCPVYIAKSTDKPNPREDEIYNCKWMTWEALESEALGDNNNSWSWWCKDQLKQLCSSTATKSYTTISSSDEGVSGLLPQSPRTD